MHFAIVHKNATYPLQYPTLFVDLAAGQPKPIVPDREQNNAPLTRPLVWEPKRAQSEHFFEFIFDDETAPPICVELLFADDKSVVPMRYDADALDYSRFVLWVAQYLNGQLHFMSVNLRIKCVDQTSTEEGPNDEQHTHRSRYPVPREAFESGVARVDTTLVLLPFNPTWR